MMRRALLFLPLLIALGLGWFLYQGLYLNPRELPSALIDKPFPEFSVPDLLNPEKTLTREDLLGKPALVNVWATWCPSCKLEHQMLVHITRNEGIPIYGINYKDDRDKAKVWLKEYLDPYAINLFDQEGRLGLDLGVYGAPETYIIDANGIIRYRHAGPIDVATWQKLRVIFHEVAGQKAS